MKTNCVMLNKNKESLIMKYHKEKCVCYSTLIEIRFEKQWMLKKFKHIITKWWPCKTVNYLGPKYYT